MFVLLMQILWLYVEKIAGKGLSPLTVMELLLYRSISLIPMALPLGILIASVMVMGGLAERYELSSIKSAGVSLLRIMRPLLIFGFFASVFSVYCNNTLIPLSNLKFGSRMFDIQQKKPALRMEPGVFNYDFQGFAIRVGSRAEDGRTIRDVLIYDHSEELAGRMSMIVAEEGEMFPTPDGKFFGMRLRNCHQYMEQRASTNDGEYPFIRSFYSRYEKVFDLSEFQLQRTNEQLFKRNRQMMSASQLAVAVDSGSHRRAAP